MSPLKKIVAVGHSYNCEEANITEDVSTELKKDRDESPLSEYKYDDVLMIIELHVCSTF